MAPISRFQSQPFRVFNSPISSAIWIQSLRSLNSIFPPTFLVEAMPRRNYEAGLTLANIYRWVKTWIFLESRELPIENERCSCYLLQCVRKAQIGGRTQGNYCPSESKRKEDCFHQWLFRSAAPWAPAYAPGG